MLLWRQRQALPSLFEHFSSVLRAAPFWQYDDMMQEKEQEQEFPLMETLAGLWLEDPLGKVYNQDEPVGALFAVDVD